MATRRRVVKKISTRLTTEASKPDVAFARVDCRVHPGDSAPVTDAQTPALAHDNARRQRLGCHDRPVLYTPGWTPDQAKVGGPVVHDRSVVVRSDVVAI